VALFNQSTKAISAAVQEIADAAGASGDTEMCNRAGRSLNAALEHWNTRANWEFLLTEAPPITVFPPFSVTGVTASAGQSSAQMPVGHGFLVDDLISVSTPPGTRVTATAVSSVGFSGSVAAGVATTDPLTAYGNRDYYPLPTDWRTPYSARLYAQQSTLRPIRRRMYDRSIVNEFTIRTSVGYDIFNIASKGKIQLLPPPAATDVLQLRYYRRMTVPTTTATADALDVPQDFEPYVIAWAKWHFLMDKGEGRGEQAATWLAFANDGIKTMMADQTRVPDEDLMFIPGAYSYNPAWGPNSVRNTLDNMWG
jgi:hypothetical protein